MQKGVAVKFLEVFQHNSTQGSMGLDIEWPWSLLTLMSDGLSEWEISMADGKHVAPWFTLFCNSVVLQKSYIISSGAIVTTTELMTSTRDIKKTHKDEINGIFFSI